MVSGPHWVKIAKERKEGKESLEREAVMEDLDSGSLNEDAEVFKDGMNAETPPLTVNRQEQQETFTLEPFTICQYGVF
ncbi:hypothetical protein Baya_1560 [Bagarius yarrelli]|uniref:Uncharacterized protein n=1 Tax=Bagarius yarrelli TaxID=175774 RepID=A0A556TLG6_BAGYA|nr:hypothetical protein Baya_1560 [Bagarius yarrelli]